MLFELVGAAVLLGAAATFFAGPSGQAAPSGAPPAGGASGDPGAGSPPLARFVWWHGLIALGLFFGLQVAGGICWYVIAFVTKRDFMSVVPLLIVTAICDAVLVLAICTAAVFMYRGRVRDLGLGLAMPRSGLQWLWVPLGTGAMFLFGIGYDQLLQLFGYQMEQELMAPLRVMTGVLPWIIVMQTAGLAIPVAEEIVFRSCVYSGFKSSLGTFWGVVLSALAFTLVHGDLDASPPLFLMGVITALAFERTRSLYVPILIHALNNIVTLTILGAT
jgi:membrane protease YdiL (CAAX protease family)